MRNDNMVKGICFIIFIMMADPAICQTINDFGTYVDISGASQSSSLIEGTSNANKNAVSESIPWMNDMELPKSGGPFPLAPVVSFQIPKELMPKGYSLIEYILLLDSGKIVLAQSNLIVLCDKNGKVIWTLAPTCEDNTPLIICGNITLVNGENGHFFVFTCGKVCPGQKDEEILEIDQIGRVVNRFRVRTPKYGPYESIVYSNGYLLVDVWNQKIGTIERKQIEIKPNGNIKPEYLVSPGDLEYSGEEELYITQNTNDNRPLYDKKGTLERDKRKGRVSNWTTKNINIKTLPFYEMKKLHANSRPTDISRRLPVKYFDSGILVVSVSIRNPLGLTPIEFSNEWDGVEKRRNMLTGFNRKGDLLWYLILSRNEEVSINKGNVCILDVRNKKVEIWSIIDTK